MSHCRNSRIERTTPTVDVACDSSRNVQQPGDVEASCEDRDEDLLEPIAVIGFSLEFPQNATSPESFWQMLLDGVSASTPIPKDRFNLESFYHADPSRTGTMNVKAAHFIKEDIAAFDAPFFSITRAEAECMDPQQRRLLETSYRALENAGIPMDKVEGSKTSVYVGSFTDDYRLLLQKDIKTQTKYFATGNESGMLANRLSWFYNLKGPSMQIDTACSSSLNALHLACQGLRGGDSTMGLVGGCNLFFNPESLTAMTDLNFLSPDGRCYSFDARANGYSRGEGFGVLVVKLVSTAIRDGDTIRAIIRATGSNQDGRTPGITQPSNLAQATLIRDTYHAAGLNMGTTRYFEAHGTGTPLGDPIEASAINSVFNKYRSHKDPLLVGALKSNIGHLEGASGVAGLIKTICVLEKGIIPRNIWYEHVNPNIPLKDWSIKFPTHTTPWPTNGLRRGSVNSFGFGGSNAHAVLDDAYHYLKLHGLSGKHCTTVNPQSSVNGHDEDRNNCQSSDARCSQLESDLVQDRYLTLLVFSAFDEPGLDRLALNYQKYFSETSPTRSDKEILHNFAFTLAQKRSLLPWKSFAVLSSVSQLRIEMKGLLSKPIRCSKNMNVAFVFTGQGTHWSAMGRELIKYPAFMESLQSANEYFRALGCQSIFIGEFLNGEDISNLGDPSISQPMCTALQVAIVQLLRSWNIKPVAVVGHSSGEIAAAYCAGSMSRKSAWKIAYYRGIVAHELTYRQREAETMMAVGLSEIDIIPFLTGYDIDDLTVSCINSPRNTTVSGKKSSILILQDRLLQDGVMTHILDVDSAYHSRSMECVASEYLSLLGDIQIERTFDDSPVMFSTVSGSQVVTSDLGERYWVSNMTNPVLFSKAVTEMCKMLYPKTEGQAAEHTNTPMVNHIIEIGPHAALRRPIAEILTSMSSTTAVGYDSVLIKGKSALESSLTIAGRLYSLGYAVDLAEVNCVPDLSSLRMLTDLPHYPFNHTQRFWKESRLSKNFRFRAAPEHELLGITMPDWNPLDARWRKVVRLSEIGWLAEHQVQGTVLYPAAAVIIMAIEAAKILMSPDQKIRGFRVQDTRFSKPIALPSDDSGIEIETCLRPLADLRTNSSNRWNFNLYMLEKGEWVQCSNGIIVAEYSVQKTQLDAGNEQENEELHNLELHREASAKCNTAVRPEDFYEQVRTAGLEYGPSFQVLRDVAINLSDHEAIAHISPCNWKFEPTESDTTRLILHPSALDGIFQLTLLALSHGHRSSASTMLPSRMDNLWITAEGVNGNQGFGELYVHAKGGMQSFRDAEFSMTALDTATGTLAIVVSCFQSVSLQRPPEHYADGPDGRLCYNIDWKPDFQLLSNQDMKAYCERSSDDAEGVVTWEDSGFIARIFVAEALSEIDEKTIEPNSYLRKYFTWMENIFRNTQAVSSHSGDFTLSESKPITQRQADLFEKLEESGAPVDQVLLKIGKNLRGIFTGEIDALALLYEDPGLLERLYHEVVVGTASSRLASYLDVIAHKAPDMEILEIGAGVGSFTCSVLDTLIYHGEKERGTPRFGNYTFTDISPTFFEKATSLFEGFKDRLTVKIFNVEQDCLEQGCIEGMYDLVLASNVLHATKDLAKTLQNVCKVLKPGGKLIIHELSNPEAIVPAFIFGLLPGWWLSTESWREGGPLITPQQWHDLLCQNGFTVDIHWPDHLDDKKRLCSMIIASVEHRSPKPPKIRTKVTIVADESTIQQDISQEINNQLTNLGDVESHIVQVHDMWSHNLDHGHCIFLPELRSPVLHDMTELFFVTLKKTICSSSMILWTSPAPESTPAGPTSGTVPGFARTITTENPTLKFVTVSLERGHGTHRVVDQVLRVYRASAVASLTTYEPEYEERGGILYINRVVEAGYVDQAVLPQSDMQERSLQKLGRESHRRLALRILSPGLLDTLEFAIDAPSPTMLAPDEIEVEVRACGLGFRDILIASGMYKDDRFGLEYAGIVIDAGSETSKKLGDRVYGWSHGCIKTHARGKDMTSLPIPNQISFTTAVAFLVGHCTSYHSLVNVARLQKYDSILIHSGAGATGQAAIQLAKLFDADIYVTVGTLEKKRIITEVYNIPQDHIFSSRTLSFQKGIKRLTRGRGVDIVLNSLTDEALHASIDCLAPFGRFVEIGRARSSHVSLAAFPNSSTYATVDLSYMLQHKPESIRDLMKITRPLIDSGAFFAPKPLHVYRSSQLEDAFRYMQGGTNIGKTVVEFNQEDMVPVARSITTSHNFDPDATYVIAGGLGGLGRSIARWMVSQRARNLLLLSRSEIYDDTQQAFLNELRNHGVNIATPPCDIASRDSLADALNECARALPPIKGCIQSALALSDAPFAQTTLPSFNTALRSKTLGSFNLHTLLPSDLTHFILLSSAAGVVGSYSQANYAAGNTYQDALARQRVTSGQRATSIDLGVILSTGFTAARPHVTRSLIAQGYMTVTEEQLLALLSYHCDPTSPIMSPLKSQVVTGLRTPAALQRAGLAESHWLKRPLFRHLREMEKRETSGSSLGRADLHAEPDYGAILSGVKNWEEAEDIVCRAILKKLAKMTGLGEADLDSGKSTFHYGVDSLGGLEIQRWLSMKMRAEVPVFMTMGAQSVREMAMSAVSSSQFVPITVREEKKDKTQGSQNA